jgi:glycosyltransferase involved in cell wall biosynthesis
MQSNKSILFVSHDVNRAGAQLFIYNVMVHLKSNGHEIVLLSKATWGSMAKDFESAFPVFYLEKKYKKSAFSKNLYALEYLKENFNFDLIYLNTIACVDILEALKSKFKIPIYCHIHELSYSIKQFGPKNSEKTLFGYSEKIIACSQAVKDNLCKFGEESKISLVHSFVNNEEVLHKIKNTSKEKTIAKYGLPKDKFLVAACGNADWRKGPDLFVQVAKKVTLRKDNVHFLWIGIDIDSEIGIQIQFDIDKLNLEKHITLIPINQDAVSLLASSDLFLLTSREDPFPLVMLEAALAEKPILGFKGSGGVSEFTEKDAGLTAPYLNINVLTELVLEVIENPELQKKLGEKAKENVLLNYSFENSIKKIERVLGF